MSEIGIWYLQKKIMRQNFIMSYHVIYHENTYICVCVKRLLTTKLNTQPVKTKNLQYNQ